MGKIIFDVNNQQVMTISQANPDGVVTLYIHSMENEINPENIWVISPGDFVMLMNYYRHQKDNGKEIFQ